MKVMFSFHEQNHSDPFFVFEADFPAPPTTHEEVTFTNTDPAIDGEVFIVVRTRWCHDDDHTTTAAVKLWRAPWSERKMVEAIDDAIEEALTT